MNHIPDDSKMVWVIICQHCNKQFNEGTPEAEFIGWHGKCAECELAYMDMLINKLTKELQDAKAQAVPEGWKLVPVEPNQAQFGGLARDVIQWMRFTESKNQHSESLVKWLKDMGNEIPDWLYSESEINHLSKHVISKGSIAAIIYKAMLEAAPEQNK